MTTAHLYLRVSTGKQADSGLGIAAQRDACLRLVESSGWTLGSEHRDEGVSGTAEVGDRPGLSAALAALDVGDVLVVAKRDRLARDVLVDVVVTRLVERSGARIVSAAGEASSVDGPTGELVRLLLAGVAQFERALASERTRAAMAAKRRRGEYTGGHIPTGMRLAADGVKLEADGDSLAAARAAQELRERGTSLRGIATELYGHGLTDRVLHPQTVKALLRLVA